MDTLHQVGAGAQPGPGGPKPNGQQVLVSAFDELIKQGYHVYFESTAPPPANTQELIQQVSQGRQIAMTLPNSSFQWTIESMKKLQEFVFAESGRTDNLPEHTQRQLSLIGQMKRKGVKFYSKPQNNKSIAVKAGPLWLLNQGSLYASINDGPKQKVTDLESFGRNLGVKADTPTPPVFTPPMVTVEAPAPVTHDDGQTTTTPPPITPTKEAPAPPGTEKPAQVQGTEQGPEASIIPVKVKDLGEKPPVEAVEEAPAAVPTSQPPRGEKPPNLYVDAIISPSAMPQEVKAAKKTAASDSPQLVVKKELIFVLPPGQEQLTMIKPSKILSGMLEKHGIPFIYMNIMAPSDGKLQSFKREHPIVSKLISESVESSVTQFGKTSNGGKAKVREVLFALPKDYDQVCNFPPTLEMASALAYSEVPVAYVRLSAPNHDQLHKLEHYLKVSAEEEAHAVPAPEAVVEAVVAKPDIEPAVVAPEAKKEAGTPTTRRKKAKGEAAA